jgi:hypothetical protein
VPAGLQQGRQRWQLRRVVLSAILPARMRRAIPDRPSAAKRAGLIALLALCSCARPAAVVPDARLAPSAGGGIPAPEAPPVEPPVPDDQKARAAAASLADRDAEGRDPELAGRIVEAARRHLDQPFRGDCSGFVKQVLAEAGVRLPPSGPARTATEALSQSTRPTTRPRPGDLAFFHDTYDRNRDGRRNDPWSHVAIVESEEDGQITLIHRGGGNVARLLMDLDRPSDPERNSGVRVRRRRDPPGTLYLTGELSAGFGVVVPADVPVALLSFRRAAGLPGRR